MNYLCKALRICDAKQANTEFVDYLAKYGKSFNTREEFLFRQSIFETKDRENRAINSNPKHTFTVGHNKFSTWTDAEY